jgi:hypothetical protein
MTIKGAKFTDEHKKNLSESHKGNHWKIKDTSKMGKHKAHCTPHTEETKNKIRKSLLKEKSYRWKGGLNSLQKLELKAGRNKPDRCEICNRSGIICFDHDHKTNKFRGWICGSCNRALGLIGDSKEILSAMIIYIDKNK